MLDKLDKLIPELCLKYMLCCDNSEELLDKLKSKVTTPFVYGRGKRKMQVSKKFIKQRKQSLANITSPMGILLRTNRSIQSERAFGVIKENYKFRQFLLRGNKKVLTKIVLVAMAYNIDKLHRKIQDNRTGTQFHGKLSD